MFFDGPNASVFVDGQDITASVRCLRLDSRDGHTPTLALDVRINEADVQGRAAVSVPEDTAQLLTALGWMPPAEPDASPAEQAADASPTPVHVTEDRQHFTRLLLHDWVVGHAVRPGLLRGLGSLG